MMNTKTKNILGITLGVILVAVIVVLFVLTTKDKRSLNKDLNAEPVMVDAGLAQIDTVALQLMESFPYQMSADIAGNYPDGCTQLGKVSQSVEESMINVEVRQERPEDAACTLVEVPFQENIPVDILGLPAGEYTVDVNGVQESFVLDIDNFIDPTLSDK